MATPSAPGPRAGGCRAVEDPAPEPPDVARIFRHGLERPPRVSASSDGRAPRRDGKAEHRAARPRRPRTRSTRNSPEDGSGYAPRGVRRNAATVSASDPARIASCAVASVNRMRASVRPWQRTRPEPCHALRRRHLLGPDHGRDCVAVGETGPGAPQDPATDGAEHGPWLPRALSRGGRGESSSTRPAEPAPPGPPGGATGPDRSALLAGPGLRNTLWITGRAARHPECKRSERDGLRADTQGLRPAPDDALSG